MVGSERVMDTLFILLAVTSLCVGIEACLNTTLMSQLTAALLAEYEKDERPQIVINGTQFATVVGLSLTINHGRIDETDATAEIMAELLVVWEDPRLTWNASEWGLGMAFVASDSIWRPDVELLNNAAPPIAEEPASIAIHPNGKAYWIPKIQVSVPCELYLEAWPNDLHVCGYEFGSKFYPITEIDYFVIPDHEDELNITGMSMEVGEWTSTLVGSQKIPVYREGGMFDMVRWAVTLERRGSALATTLRITTAAVCLLLLAALASPPQERAAPLAAGALSATIQLMMIAGRLPPAMSSPRCMRLQAALLIVCVASSVTAGLVRFVGGLRARPPSLRMRQMLAKIAMLSLPSTQKSERPTDEDDSESTSNAALWEGAARFLDFIFSLVTSLVVIVLLACYL